MGRTMPNRHDEFLNTRTFHDLDGLRAISVIAVVWHHTAALAFPDVHVLQQGLYGVDFFFAISGFLITTLLLREHRRTGRISYRRFLGRRALRIFPLFYVVLATYVLLTIATRRGTPEATEFFHNLPAFATYTSNWFVDLEHGTSVTFYFAWSLATEEQFYLLWPPLLILLLARWRRSVVAPIVAVLAANVVRPVVGHDFGIVVFLGASAIAYIAAEISYRWFELPLLRVKDRLFASPGKAAPALVTPPIPRPADG
jgi:peptidoglycan/LPS O-acetylase OafA/YrhL